MRFGKRPRSTRLFGRKSTQPPAEAATPESAAYEPVQHEEWNALVSPDGPEGEWSEDGGGDSAAFSSNEAGEQDAMSAETGRETTLDPTNRLLTALGRFHREVLKAREGSAHGQWPDVCMNQLISAVEIALEQGWTEVVESLGETGRVLQSYAEAGRAHDSVVFLEDSYEMLCLMVGDLIVGSVRPGVVQKWKDRYARAIEDLEAAGLKLVDDEDGFAPTMDAEDPPFDEAAALESAVQETAFDPLPALDTLAPLDDEMAVAGPASEPHVLSEVDVLLDTVSEALALIEIDPSGKHPAAFATIADAVESLVQEAKANGRHSAAFVGDVMSRLCDSAQQLESPLDDRFFELAYGFPGLYAEASDGPGDDSVDAWTMECETLLLSWSDVTDQDMTGQDGPAGEAPMQDFDLDSVDGDDAPFDTGALDRLATDAAAPPSASELPDLGAIIEEAGDDLDPIEEVAGETGEWEAETAQAAPDLEAALEDDAAASVLDEAIEDDEAKRQAVEDIVEDIVEAETESAMASAAEAILPLDEVIDTPMQILKVAEQAVSEGRAVNAKLLLLQAAASIAESEAAEAQRSLEDATKRIQEEAEAIETAMKAVGDAEAQVAEAEKSVTEGAEAIETHRAQVSEQGGRVDEVQARIEAIDEEIRALQARREEEAELLEQTRADLAAVEADTAHAEEEAARLEAAEAEARQQLEEARAKVKHHQRRRQEFESALDRANEEVRERSESLSDLRHTMTRFLAPEAAVEQDSGDLFGPESTE